MHVHSPLSPVIGAYLAAAAPAGRVPGPAMAGLASAVRDAATLWRPIVRHDPLRRWYERLHRDDRVEVWLLGWDVGQDTRVHDHGGSSGAFAVAEGTLTELHTVRTRRGPLRRRVHEAGRSVAFGPSYVHDLGNQGPGPATSVHVYSPPLSTMTYYDLVHGVPVATERLAVDGREVRVP